MALELKSIQNYHCNDIAVVFGFLRQGSHRYMAEEIILICALFYGKTDCFDLTIIGRSLHLNENTQTLTQMKKGYGSKNWGSAFFDKYTPSSLQQNNMERKSNTDKTGYRQASIHPYAYCLSMSLLTKTR